jgi:hypothetical protein
MSESQQLPAMPEASTNLPRRRDGSGVAAVIAAFVGLLALCVSGYTAYLQRQQVRAQVWPYIEFGSSNSRHELDVMNKGVGPAIIRMVQIYVDGKPQHNWKQVYAALGLRFEHPPLFSTINSVVISAGEHIRQVVFADEADFNTFVAQAKRVDMSVCYCSTLGECWLIDDREKDRALRFREINTCPAASADDFIDNNTAEAAPAAKQEDK